MLKKISLICLMSAIVFAGMTTISSCKTKEGCGLEDEYRPKLDSKKRGKSNLFKKKNRKKARN